MKKFIYSLLFLTYFFINIKISGQEPHDIKYRRSSLSMLLIESESFPNKDAVMQSWNHFPFPDKYNKHEIDLKSFHTNAIQLTDQDLLDAGFLMDTLKNPFSIALATSGSKKVRYLNSNNTRALALPSEEQEHQLKIDKVIREEKLANKVVANWFSKSADGIFDMSLIQERGFYDATEMEASIAQGQARGMASLGDAGAELLQNTFVTFSSFNFIENEPVARFVRDTAKEKIRASMSGKSPILLDAALMSADKTYDKTKEGYSLWSKTWLYSLNWNDSIAAVFYSELWSNPDAFDESDLFSFEFLGIQENKSLVTFKLGETRTQEEIIDLALVRNVDAAFAKLQKDHDVFKPKIPVLSTDPITAQIGMKEGLTGGEKFEVLELTYNQRTGKTEYKVVGRATVDRSKVWDNRYNAGNDPETIITKDKSAINATLFKGSKSVEPGMLLKQIK